MMKRILSVAALIGAIGAGGAEPMLLRVPEMKQPPGLDGQIGADEWRHSAEIADAVEASGRALARRVTFRMAQDRDYWYFAFRREAGPDGRVLSRARSSASTLFDLDDLLEFEAVPPGENRLYHYAVNAAGLFRARSLPLAFAAPDEQAAAPWDGAKNIEVKSRIEDGFWELEMRVPKDAFGGRAPRGEIWRMQLRAKLRRPAQIGTLAHESSDRFVESMPTIIADASAPGLRMARRDAGSYVLDIRNNTANALNCLLGVHSGDKSTSMPLIVPANGEQHIPLQIAGGDTPRNLGFALRNASGGGTYFRRSLTPAPTTERQAARAASPVRDPVFHHRYEPAARKVAATLAHLPANARVRWRITDAKKQIRASGMTSVSANRRAAWEAAAPNAEGVYDISASVTAPDGAHADYQGKFEVKRFVWLGNQLGKSRTAIPPYPPVRRNGSTVRAADAKISFANGLPSAIDTLATTWIPAPPKSEDGDEEENAVPAPLIRCEGKASARLAAPVELRFAGRPIGKRRTGTPVLREAGALRVQFADGADDPDWKIRTVNTVDFDGAVRSDLEITPAKTMSGPLELVIPLDRDIVKTLRTVSDAIEPARMIDLTRSTAWNSFSAPRMGALPGNPVPYLHIGNGMRGLAVYTGLRGTPALDGKNPAWRIARNDTRIELVRRIADHVRAGENIRFTAGFQPTPVRAETPAMRTIADDWTPWPSVQMLRTLRHPMNWGGMSDTALAPAQKDYSLLKRIGEAQYHSTRDDAAFIENFVKRHGANFSRPELAYFRSRAQQGMDAGVGCDKLLIRLRAGAFDPASEACRIYRDEWLQRPRQIAADGKLRPDASYRDYYLAQAEKLLDAGADGFELAAPELLDASDIFAGRELLIRLNALLAARGKYLSAPGERPREHFADALPPDALPAGMRSLRFPAPKSKLELRREKENQNKAKARETAVNAAKLRLDRPLLALDNANCRIAPYASLAAIVCENTRVPDAPAMPPDEAERNGAVPTDRYKIPPRELLQASRVATARSLLYELPLIAPGSNLGSVFFNTWREIYRFGYAEPDMQVARSSRGDRLDVQCADRNIGLTLFRRTGAPKQALLAVVNTAKSSRQVRIDIAGLKIPHAAVNDYPGGDTLPVEKKHVVVEVPAQDFRLLKIAEPEENEEE